MYNLIAVVAGGTVICVEFEEVQTEHIAVQCPSDESEGIAGVGTHPDHLGGSYRKSSIQWLHLAVFVEGWC